MTIGIYKLSFQGTDKVYIGQSVNLEKRFIQHKADMRAGRSSPKLQEAYTLYNLPKQEVLCECLISELDTLEEEAISIFNSVENGFNTFTYVNEAPILKGPEHGNAKFSRQQILQVACLLTDPSNTFKCISDLTGVTVHVISSISSLSSHHWLCEEEPILYNKIAELKNTRNKVNSIKRGDIISAKNRGIIYPPIKNPEGSIFIVENAYAFAREHGLRGNHLTEVLNGYRKSHKGWKICLDEQV